MITRISCSAHLPPFYCYCTQNKWYWNDNKHYHPNAKEKEWKKVGCGARLSSIIQENLQGKWEWELNHTQLFTNEEY